MKGLIPVKKSVEEDDLGFCCDDDDDDSEEASPLAVPMVPLDNAKVKEDLAIL